MLHLSRRALIGSLGASAGLGFSACSSNRPDNTLNIGATATGAPFSFLDAKSGQLTGAMIDIANQVIAQAGLASSLETVPFAALIPSLTTNKIDVIAAAMLRTPERETVVSFTRPVYTYGGGLVVRDDMAVGQWGGLEALRGRKVAVQVGTRFVDQVAQAGVKDALTYDNLGDCIRDLKNKRVDFVYGDAPILSYQIDQGQAAGVKLVPEFTAPSKEELCLIVRKGDNAQIVTLNAAIDTLQAEVIPGIIAKWKLVA